MVFQLPCGIIIIILNVNISCVCNIGYLLQLMF